MNHFDYLKSTRNTSFYAQKNHFFPCPKRLSPPFSSPRRTDPSINNRWEICFCLCLPLLSIYNFSLRMHYYGEIVLDLSRVDWLRGKLLFLIILAFFVINQNRYIQSTRLKANLRELLSDILFSWTGILLLIPPGQDTGENPESKQ